MQSKIIAKTIDRDAAMEAVSRILRSHRCRDWYCEDDESSMQLIDVLSQHSEDGTVTRAMEECDDLASDIVDEILTLPNAPDTWKDVLARDSVRIMEARKPQAEIAKPCSEAEVAEALHTISCLTKSEELIRVIRRLVFERDILREKCQDK